MRAQPKAGLSRAAKTPKPRSSAERVRAYRAKMKKRGMKLTQRWLPDVNSPKFKAEALRQSRNLAAAADEEDVMRFIESLYEDWD
jgi:hypothetical protein